MTPDPSRVETDRALVAQCLAGDPAALAQLRDRYGALLVGVLQKRGAHRSEAEDVVADLWAACVVTEERPSLLEKFNGLSHLRTWLLVIATNRLVDLRRRQRVRSGPPGAVEAQAAHGSAPAASGGDEGLTRLLRASLRRALDRCPADALLMLRLVYLHGLTQREVGRMWCWHESKVSRTMAEAMRFIAHHTMESVRRQDAWLRLEWGDFLELCEGTTSLM